MLGYTRFYGEYETTFYNHVALPNSRAVSCGLSGSDNSFLGSFPARSYHGGGVNVTTMGAVVKFVSDRIDIELWRSLSTRNGGEVVGNV